MTKFDEDIKQKLSDFQEPEPEGLWDDILAGLNVAGEGETAGAVEETDAGRPTEPHAAAADKERHARKPRRAIIYAVSSIAAAAVIALGVFLLPGEKAIAPTISVVEQPGLLAEAEEPSPVAPTTTESGQNPETFDHTPEALSESGQKGCESDHSQDATAESGQIAEESDHSQDATLESGQKGCESDHSQDATMESGQKGREGDHSLQAENAELLAEASLEHIRQETTLESGQKGCESDHSQDATMESGQKGCESDHSLQAENAELLAEASLEHIRQETTMESGQKGRESDHSQETTMESGQKGCESDHSLQAENAETSPEEEKPISIYSEEYKYIAGLGDAEEVVEQVRRKRTFIGLMADGVMVPGSSAYGYNQTFNQADNTYTKAAIKMNGMTVDPISNIKRLNKGQDITTNTRYTPPVRSGLMFRWTYKSGIGIETGLQYSYMKSITESGTAANFSRIDNECHFIGIPFNLSYSFWGNKHLGVYINAGILMERMVKHESTTRYFVNNEQLGNTIHEGMDLSRYQWSANASAGIQYNILGWLALYAEPGVTYFMNNESLYGDHPWNFNVRLGLRFDISSKK